MQAFRTKGPGKRARQRALLDAIGTHPAEFIGVEPDDAGLCLVGWEPDRVDDKEVSPTSTSTIPWPLPCRFTVSDRWSGADCCWDTRGAEDAIDDEGRCMAEVLIPFRT